MGRAERFVHRCRASGVTLPGCLLPCRPFTGLHMEHSDRPSGIPSVGDVPWGTHFCQFYKTADDLADTLVPFFEAGLRSNESCLWVTGEKLEAEAAEALMVDAVTD